MSKMDLDRAQENYERLEVQNAKRVLKFYKLRRNLSEAANSTVSGASANVPVLTDSGPDQIAVVASPYQQEWQSWLSRLTY